MSKTDEPIDLDECERIHDATTDPPWEDGGTCVESVSRCVCRRSREEV